MGIKKSRLKSLNIAESTVKCSICDEKINQDQDFLIKTHTTYSATYGGPLCDPYTTFNAFYHISCYLGAPKTKKEKLKKEIEILKLEKEKRELENEN